VPALLRGGGVSQAGRRTAGFVLAALVLAADQGAKSWVLHGSGLGGGRVMTAVPGLLNFVLVWNHGITFGMFSHGGAKPILAFIAAVVVLFLGVWLWRSRNWIATLAIGAIAGGAVGNILDRLRFGAVVDFLQMHAGALYFPWIFNVGDSAICCGVAALMLESVLTKRPVAADSRQR
jgi:lipoprotein signal peptidase